ncbi:MAG: HNH endonuclease [Ignavibacteria bacterium]|nr:HNH endonuclease [Ignavibacteria bacterium]
MLKDLRMPPRKDVEKALLVTLFKHNGIIKEFGPRQEIVDEIANEFRLNEKQRAAFLQTIYRKENRVKKSFLWHRLLFRAADSLANEKLVSRPTSTLQLTKKREWMLTEKGFDEALKLLRIPNTQKEFLPTKSFEVQRVIKKLTDTRRPKSYNPFDNQKKTVKVTRNSILRERGFRQAVIEAYDFRCAACGMKINSPDSLYWEVEAAHIVPHRHYGKDDVWNGLSLCRFHHWAFDVGWFALRTNFTIEVAPKINSLPVSEGRMGNYEVLKNILKNDVKIILPKQPNVYPHVNAILWHRKHIFHSSERI